MWACVSYQCFLFLFVTSQHVLIRAAQIQERKNNKIGRKQEAHTEKQTEERASPRVCLWTVFSPALIHVLFPIIIPDTASEKFWHLFNKLSAQSASIC